MQVANACKCPKYLSSKFNESLDEYSSLDGHVKATGDAGALQRLRRSILGTHRHQSRHLILGKDDLLKML